MTALSSSGTVHDAPPLGWALLGASAIAETRFLPAVTALGHTTSIVYSTSEERGRKFASSYTGMSSTDDLNEVLARADVDAVYISTTNDRHRALAEAAAAAGKHVLCEKPLADNLVDARAIVEVCEREGVVLAVNHHLPGAGTHRKIRELIANGAIGDIKLVRIAHAGFLPAQYHRWRLDGSPGSGVILDVTTHAAAALNAILSPRVAKDVVATSLRHGPWEPKSDDSSMAIIRYGEDVLAQTMESYVVPHAASVLDIYGSRGSIRGYDVLSQDPRGEVQLSDASGTRVIEVDDRTDLYQSVASHFAAAIAGIGQPTVTGRQGLESYLVAEAIRMAATRGERVLVEHV